MKKIKGLIFGILAVAGSFLSLPSSGLGLQWTRTEETLINYLRGGKVEVKTADDYINGKLRFVDYTLYRAILADGFTGIQKIWDTTVSKAIGVTNVDKARLDKDVHICIDTLLIGYANSGGAGTDPSAQAAYDHVVTSWPAALVNAEIQVYQDGVPVTSPISARLCGSMADGTFGVGRGEGYLFKNPFILEGDKPFEVRMEFPGTISVANTDFIRVEMLGVGTRKKNGL
jgi:hypothetical protein